MADDPPWSLRRTTGLALSRTFLGLSHDRWRRQPVPSYEPALALYSNCTRLSDSPGKSYRKEFVDNSRDQDDLQRLATCNSGSLPHGLVVSFGCFSPSWRVPRSPSANRQACSWRPPHRKDLSPTCLPPSHRSGCCQRDPRPNLAWGNRLLTPPRPRSPTPTRRARRDRRDSWNQSAELAAYKAPGGLGFVCMDELCEEIKRRDAAASSSSNYGRGMTRCPG